MTVVWDIRWPTQNHLLVMLKLADHANDEGAKVWPAVATIAEQAQCSERTVQNVLKALRDCGLITVSKPGGGSMPTIYAINVPLLKTLTGQKLEGSADKIDLPDDIYPQDAQTGATVAPLPIAPVQPATGTGANEGGGGAKLLHPNHQYNHQENLHLRKVSNFDLKSEGKKPVVSFVITNSSAHWQHWQRWLTELGRQDLADRMDAIREITVYGSRWPQPDSPIPKIPKPTIEDDPRLKKGQGGSAA